MIRRIVVVILVALMLCIPVSASEIEAPVVPDSGKEFMPDDPQSFSEGLIWVLRQAAGALYPAITDATKLCVGVIAIIILTSIVSNIPGSSETTVNLVAVLAVSAIILGPSKLLIHRGADTVKELQEYGKLLLPVMTTALAAQGGTISAAALYAGTAAFNTILGSIISNLIVPMIYIYLCMCVADSALGDKSLSKLKGSVKWFMTWLLKTVLYVFTGYMGITGVVSGTTDAAALKAAKLTISGMVPMVGNILSDASEAVLVSAGIMKNAAGIYGLLAMIAVCVGPFVQIGSQYLLLKLTAAVCDIFGTKKVVGLVQDFSGMLGMLLAMTGTMCLLLLISTVCLMKGMSR